MNMLKKGDMGFAFIKGNLEEVEVINVDRKGQHTVRDERYKAEHVVERVFPTVKNAVIFCVSIINMRHDTAFRIEGEESVLKEQYKKKINELKGQLSRCRKEERERMRELSIVTLYEFSQKYELPYEYANSLFQRGKIVGQNTGKTIFINLPASIDLELVMIKDSPLLSHRTVKMIQRKLRNCTTILDLAKAYHKKDTSPKTFKGIGEIELEEIRNALADQGFFDKDTGYKEELAIFPGEDGYDINAIPELPKVKKEKVKSKKERFFALIDEVQFMHKVRGYTFQQIADFLKRYRKLDIQWGYCKELYALHERSGNPYTRKT